MPQEPRAMVVTTWMARIGGGLFAVIAVVITIDVIARNLFGRVVLDAFEISTYLFAAAIGFGLAQTALTGAHIRIDVLLQKLPARWRRPFDVAAALTLAGLAAFFAWHAVGTALESFHRGIRSNSTLSLPLAGPQAIWAFGFVAFALASAWVALRALWLALRGRGGEVDDLLGAAPAGVEAAE